MRAMLWIVGLTAFGWAAVAATAEDRLSYADHVRPIFVQACGDCHGDKRPKKGLNLLAPNAVAQMLDRPSQSEPEVVLVKAGDPAASYLWRKLAHTHREGKGMPRGLFTASRLPADQLDLVSRWIAQGAQP